jgi:hypothetical protein
MAVVKDGLGNAPEDRALDTVEAPGPANDQGRFDLVGDLDDGQPDGHSGLFSSGVRFLTSQPSRLRPLVGSLTGSGFFASVQVALIRDVRSAQPGVEAAGHQTHRNGFPDGQNDRVPRRQQLGGCCQRSLRPD